MDYSSSYIKALAEKYARVGESSPPEVSFTEFVAAHAAQLRSEVSTVEKALFGQPTQEALNAFQFLLPEGKEPEIVEAPAADTDIVSQYAVALAMSSPDIALTVAEIFQQWCRDAKRRPRKAARTPIKNCMQTALNSGVKKGVLLATTKEVPAKKGTKKLKAYVKRGTPGRVI